MTENEKDMLEASQADSQNTASEAGETAVQPEEELFEWKEPPHFTIEHQEDCVCKVQVTIPAVNVKAVLDEVYEEVNDGVQVPGFRRGKAPRKLLEKRLGKYARSTVVERLTDAASQLLVKEHDVKPISKADVEGLDDPESLPEDQDLVYTISFETAGTCELADYTQFELKRPEYEVEQSDVDNAIENMRMRFGRYEPLTEGTAQDGDQVIIDFKGTIDGEEFEGNSAENYPYILGTKRFHENMEAAMQGAKAGDEVETNLTFPEDYREQSLAGKEAHFKIKINEIKRRSLPELNDEFAKKVGHDTVAELQESVRKRIAENTDSQVGDMLRDQAMSKLIEASTFTLPKKQTQQFIDSERNALLERLRQQHVSAEEIEERAEEINKAAEEQGIFAIKSMYAINAIGEKEDIEVTEADFDTYARSLASGDEPQFELMKQYLAEEDVRSASAYRIMTTKALDAIVAKAAIKAVPISELQDDETTQEDAQDA